MWHGLIDPHHWVAQLRATRAAKPQEDWDTHVDPLTAFDWAQISELDDACMSAVGPDSTARQVCESRQGSPTVTLEGCAVRSQTGQRTASK